MIDAFRRDPWGIEDDGAHIRQIELIDRKHRKVARRYASSK